MLQTNRQLYAASRLKQPSREELLADAQKRAEDIQALAQQIVLAKRKELSEDGSQTLPVAKSLFGDIISDALNDIIMPVVNAIMTAVKPVLTAVINELLTLISDIANSALGGLVVSIIQDFDTNPNPLQALLNDMGLGQIEPLFVNLMAHLFDTLIDELGKGLKIARIEVSNVSADIARFMADAFSEIQVVYKTLRKALSDITGELETIRFLTGRGGSPDSLVATIKTVFEDSLSTVRDIVEGVEDRIEKGLRRMVTDLDATYQEVVSDLEQECAKFYGDFQRIYREILSELLAKIHSLTNTIRLEMQSAERQLLMEEQKLKQALESRVDVVVDYADKGLHSVGGAIDRVGQKVALTADRAEGVIKQGLKDADAAIKDVEGWLSFVKIAILVAMVVFIIAIIFVMFYVYSGAKVAHARALGSTHD